MNQAYVDAGYVMDPHRPQGLVYANTKHGPVLLGAMFQMKRIGPVRSGPWRAADRVAPARERLLHAFRFSSSA